MAKLIVMFNNKVLNEIAVGKQPVRIGRDADNEIQIENPAVSRHHAEIYRQGYPFYIEDKKSTNGTYVNGSFVNWKVALNDNDRISIGKHTILFQHEAKDFPDRQKPKPGSFDETMMLNPGDIKK